MYCFSLKNANMLAQEGNINFLYEKLIYSSYIGKKEKQIILNVHVLVFHFCFKNSFKKKFSQNLKTDVKVKFCKIAFKTVKRLFECPQIEMTSY